jgi:hypothetical protein
MANLQTTFTDLALSESANTLFQEALTELDTCQRDRAKNVIKQRLLEIKRMEACLEKAKADLAKLLDRDVEEILMLEA